LLKPVNATKIIAFDEQKTVIPALLDSESLGIHPLFTLFPPVFAKALGVKASDLINRL